MSNRQSIFLGGLLMASLIAVCAVAVLKIDLTDAKSDKPQVVRTRNFGEGLTFSRHGLYGVDLVSIGKAHMRKVRKGPFTIGALNELVLDDVSLALPEELWRGEAKRPPEAGAQAADVRGETGPKRMLGKLGIDAGNLKLGAKVPRFSALKINRLNVSRLDGTNVAPWFAAASGTAKRGGLHLRSGWSVENGVSNVWSEAFFLVEPNMRLITNI